MGQQRPQPKGQRSQTVECLWKKKKQVNFSKNLVVGETQNDF
jgi:hypothetical protein